MKYILITLIICTTVYYLWDMTLRYRAKIKKCKTCKYFNTFGTNNFYGVCDLGGLTSQEESCVKYKERE